MKQFDAHNHFHDARLQPHLAAILPSLDVQCAVVNGTCESDWAAVAALAKMHAWVLPSFGLHPWFVAGRSPKWSADLRAQLEANPRAGVGEIGLDRWVKDHDSVDQTRVFTGQLRIAAELNRAATIHCIQAWGGLWDVLRAERLPERGFLIHAFGGSLEMMRNFASVGAYFSFSPSFLQERKAAQREVFAAVPEDRLLVETDAPDLPPPPAQNPHPLCDEAGAPLNHPANIGVAYAGLAKVRGLTVEALSEIVAGNFARLFLQRD